MKNVNLKTIAQAAFAIAAFVFTMIAFGVVQYYLFPHKSNGTLGEYLNGFLEFLGGALVYMGIIGIMFSGFYAFFKFVYTKLFKD